MRWFFTKTLPVTAGLLQAVNHAPPLARFRTAAWAPSSAGNAIRHVPRAPRTTQEGMQGHTQTSQCARTHTSALAFMHTHTHTLHTSQESSGCEVDRFVASGVGGKKNFTTSGGFSGFSHWDVNTTETPNFLFGKYQKDGRALCVRACQAVRENISDSCLKLNLGKK